MLLRMIAAGACKMLCLSAEKTDLAVVSFKDDDYFAVMTNQ